MVFPLNLFLLVTFLAGAVLFPGRADSIELKPRIEALLSEALGARIEIRELHWVSLSEVSVEGIVAKKEGWWWHGLIVFESWAPHRLS